jgi:hypothetical protein
MKSDIEVAVDSGYLNEICTLDSLESRKPKGVIGLPPGYGVWPAPGIEKLIVEEKDGVLTVNEAVVEEMKQFGDQIFVDGNNIEYNEIDWKTTYGTNPWWVLGFMRRHQGVVAHKPGPDPATVVHLGRKR